MRLVPRPFLAPHRCAGLAHIGQSTQTRWIDTGNEMRTLDGHIYLSEVAVQEACRLLGYPSRGDYWMACRGRDEAMAELERVRAELATAREQLAAVEVLKQTGFVQQRKPGRPAKEKANAA